VLDIVNFGKIVSYHHIIYTVRGQDYQDFLNRAFVVLAFLITGKMS